MNRHAVEQQLGSIYPTDLGAGLLDSFQELKTAYMEGRLRPSELEGGHFAEYAFRICEHACTGTFTPIGTALRPVDQLVRRLGSSASGHDSFRLHIPRVLFGIFEIRNRRGVGHPSGDVNPNVADSEFVTTTASWVVAELLRHAYNTDMESAQALVDSLVKRHSPLVEDIDGFPKLLRPELSVPDRVLVLLNHRRSPMPPAELRKALSSVSGSRLVRVLADMEKRALVHTGSTGCVLTRRGIECVEAIIRANSGA